MKLRRIDYLPAHPQNIRVSFNSGSFIELPAPAWMATISCGKTDDSSEDWVFMPRCRLYEDGAQGFEFVGANALSAVVWLECDQSDMTIAEENDPGVVYVACIPRCK